MLRDLFRSLRELPPTQQVALLFVILFGLLLVATAVTTLLSVREMSPLRRTRHERFKRDLATVRGLGYCLERIAA